MTKTKMKDVVVILPGIIGSVLKKNGRDLWGASAQAIFDIIKSGGNNLQQLKLQGEDSGGDYHDDGIKADRLVPDAQIIPGLIKILDGYSTTSRLITDNFQVIEGDVYQDAEDKAANFYHFPYDWRRDNRINAKILKRLLDIRLKAWRESQNSDAKVILLAHSMGGLVARYYLEVLGGWKDCRALFTFGTPYRGSVNAVNFIANGFKKASIDLTEVIRSLPSVYQLLPIYLMLHIGNENKRIAEVANLPNIEQNKAKDALAFHQEIESAVANNSKDCKYYDQFATVPFIGVQQPTLQSAELKDGVIKVSREIPRIMRGKNLDSLADGDGTVPQISAFPIEFSDQEVIEIISFIAEKHGSLQNQEDILLSLLNKLQLAETLGNITDIRGRGDAKARSIQVTTGIGLDLEDSYSQDEAITIKAQVNGDAHFDGLKATIECLSDPKAPLNLDFEADGSGFIIKPENLELDLGLYRIKVQTDSTAENSPSEVHDLFAIT